MSDDPVNSLSMAASTPIETPRLLKEWRHGFTPILSQIKAAEKLGVQLRTYTRWERGENYPQLGNIEQIAPIMGLLVEDFYPVGDETPSETRARIARMEEKLEENNELLRQLLQAAQVATASRALAQPGQAGRRSGSAARRRSK
jgi:transcriptional regulator with XRE-family HTH domain